RRRGGDVPHQWHLRPRVPARRPSPARVPLSLRGVPVVGALLLRGMLAGLIAGLLAFGFARLTGEIQIDRAVAFEEKMAAAKGEAHEPELVSRTTQAGAGLLTGVVIYGATMGGLVSLAFAFLYGRLGRMGPRGLAALLAAGGFVVIVLVPFLKYPA